MARDTAIGPRAKGGLNNMDWSDHVTGFQAEWMIRYLQPGEAAWKQIMDQFILYDKKGKLRYPEGRGSLLMNLSARQKTAIIASIPKGAEYMRTCLREFWKLRIRPVGMEGVGTESPWHRWRFKADTTNAMRAYAKNVLNVTQMTDFMDVERNRPFTKGAWIAFVEELEEAHTGVKPAYRDAYMKAEEMVRIQKNKSRTKFG